MRKTRLETVVIVDRGHETTLESIAGEWRLSVQISQQRISPSTYFSMMESNLMLADVETWLRSIAEQVKNRRLEIP